MSPGQGSTVASIGGVQGPWGAPVAMTMPYAASPPGEAAARAMLQNSIPMDLVQAALPGQGVPGGIVPAGFQQGGPMPLPHQGPIRQVSGACPTGPGMPGVVAAVGALTGGAGAPGGFPAKRTEVRFAAPAGMKVSWCSTGPDGKAAFVGNQLDVPARYNFLQAAIYRLKLSDIPNRPGLELYPTLEVVPSNAKTDVFLAHSAVPVVFTDEDFEQVAAGNFLVKVIYLPDPQFQELGVAGPDEVVSTRLEPGCDPIAEAHRRGCILLIVRVGNIDLEAPNTPAMDAPGPHGPQHAAGRPGLPPGAAAQGPMPGMRGPGMMPPGMMPPGMMGQGRPGMGLYGPMPGMPMPQQQPNLGVLPPSVPRQPARGPVSQAPDGMNIQLTDYRAVPPQAVPAPPVKVAERPAKPVTPPAPIATPVYLPENKQVSSKGWWSAAETK
jgi:hypothetical protein